MSTAESPTLAQVYAWDNLWLAWRKASRGKRGREDLAPTPLPLA